MEIQVVCPTCSKVLKAPAAAAGKKARCPQCKGVIVIPQSAVASSSLDEELWGELPRKAPPAASSPKNKSPSNRNAALQPQPPAASEPGLAALGAATFDKPIAEGASQLKGTGGSTFHVPTRLAPPALRQLRLNATSRDSRILPWLFSLTLLPLLLTIFMSDTDVRSRVEKTLEHHPEIAQHADTVNSEEDLFSILPDHRIEAHCWRGTA